MHISVTGNDFHNQLIGFIRQHHPADTAIYPTALKNFSGYLRQLSAKQPIPDILDIANAMLFQRQ